MQRLKESSLMDKLLILCGGEGKRLQEIWKLPKVLCPVGPITYLEFILNNLKDYFCFSDITLSVGKNSYLIREFIESKRIDVDVINEKTPLGTGGAILNFMNSKSIQRTAVLNGDTLISKNDLNIFFNESDSYSGNLLAIAKVKENDSRYGSVLFDPFLRIQKPIVKKYADVVYAGLCTLNCQSVPQNTKFPMSLEDLLHHAQLNVKDTKLIEFQNGFHDIGTPKDLYSVATWLKNNS